MEQHEYEKMYQLEEEHWYFKGKRNLILNLAKKYIAPIQNKLLDVGCGTGIIMKYLQPFGGVHGVDYADEAIKYCKERGLANVKKSEAESLPYEAASFNVISFFDVLYHKGIKDDILVLQEAHRVLKDNGIILITESANKWLWSKHDIAAHARQRYTRKELKRKLQATGFKVEKISYFNSFILPLVIIHRKLLSKFSKEKEVSSDIQQSSKAVNKLLYVISSIETSFIKVMNLPCGVGLVAVARKI